MAQRQQLDEATIVQHLVPELMKLNPDSNPDMIERRSKPPFLTFEKETGQLKTWDLHGLKLQRLPEAFSLIDCTEDLDLGGNQLTALPEGFGHVVVGNRCWINNNSLEGLPPGFANVTAKHLCLDQAFAHEVKANFAKLTKDDFPNCHSVLLSTAS